MHVPAYPNVNKAAIRSANRNAIVKFYSKWLSNPNTGQILTRELDGPKAADWSLYYVWGRGLPTTVHVYSQELADGSE